MMKSNEESKDPALPVKEEMSSLAQKIGNRFQQMGMIMGPPLIVIENISDKRIPSVQHPPN